MQRNIPSVTFTTAEQAEIYLRALLLGMTEGAVTGVTFALLGHTVGSFCGAFYYAGLPLPEPFAPEQLFTRTEVILTGLQTGAMTGLAAAAISFFPAVTRGLNEGFEKGPKAVDPLAPLQALGRLLIQS